MKDLAIEFDQSSFSEKIYTAILHHIINHQIKPGEKLSEERIASILNVSRTPVREALKRLAADGLIDYYPRRGAYTKEITPQDITELYEIRRCLEVHAARKTIGNIPKKRIRWINKLIESCHLAEGVDFIEAELQLDREIHKTINSCCGNVRLKEMLEKLDHLAKFMRILHFNREELVRENFVEHEGIWNALASQDEKLMVKLLEEHLDNRKKCLLEHFSIIHTSEEAIG
ncbi:MAG: GntR family transcriptional regulator [Candidatus Latescibacteria bacterium]|jgi:DNA-binding GntR family transcriptional regulator|nr:GntR family transcriptional regulator [Candidatus Latescibacterota bacterium]